MTVPSPYQVAPALSSDDYERLKASIAEKGVVYPVIKDERGEIIDGHHRDAIARELGITYKIETVSGLCDEEKRILAATLNLARRQLTDAQKTIMGQRIESDIAALARRRQGERTDLRGATSGTTVPDVAPTPPKRTRDEVAKTVGLSNGRQYERNKQVIAAIEKEPDGPQLLQHVESGDWDIPDARKELERREKERQAAEDERRRQAAAVVLTPEVEEALKRPAYEDLAYALAKDLTKARQPILALERDLRRIPDDTWAEMVANYPNLAEAADEFLAYWESFVGLVRRGLPARQGHLRRVM